MKDESNQPDSPADSSQQDPVTHHPPKISAMDRRKFVGLTATAALSFTIVPRHVLGGKNYIAPSDKLTVAYIGTGTEGTRGLLDMLMIPEIQLVSVCDPNQEAIGYRDWGTDYLKNDIRKVEETTQNQLLKAFMPTCASSRNTKVAALMPTPANCWIKKKMLMQ